MKNNLFELNKEQKKAFERMRRAHKDCIKLGLKFYNNYGSLGVIVADRFEDEYYSDSDYKSSVRDNGQNQSNEINDPNFVSLADDPHWFHPKL